MNLSGVYIYTNVLKYDLSMYNKNIKYRYYLILHTHSLSDHMIRSDDM